MVRVIEKFSKFWNDAEGIDVALFMQANLNLCLDLHIFYAFMKSIKSKDGVEAAVFCLLLLLINACKP